MHALDSSSICSGVLQAGTVETLGTTAFSPPAAVRQVATSRGPSMGKHLTFHTSNSLELIGLLLVGVAAQRPQNSPLRQCAVRGFRGTIPCGLESSFWMKKCPNQRKNMPNPWCGTALPLSCYTNQRPTRAQARTQKSGNSARRSRVRKKPSLILPSPCLTLSVCDRHR
jgi:hypothetical protein